MDDDNKVTFEEIFKQNERRIHYHIHKLRINDPLHEFYTEGLYAMWTAYKKYQPDKGPLATYFNYTIRHRLIDMIRKKTREEHHHDTAVQAETIKQDNGNRFVGTNSPIVETAGITMEDDSMWDEVKSRLSDRQWKWVYFYIIQDMPLMEIAKQEGVSVDAVKSWGRESRKKLRGWKERFV